MKKIKPTVIALCALSTLASCVNVEQALHLNKDKKKSNRVTNTREANQIISDGEVEIQVISETALKIAKSNNSILSIQNPKMKEILKSLPQGPAIEKSNKSTSTELVNTEESLVIGFPIGLIGEQAMFGGVITKVSDTQDESIGTLKLTDLPPIHVRPFVSQDDKGQPVMVLVGCVEACEESSQQLGLLSFPIIGLNPETSMLMVDMSSVGTELNLIGMMDPYGLYTGLITVASDTTSVEFDTQTMLFDVKTKMIPLMALFSDTKNPKTTDITVRWYMKLGSSFNPAFTARNEAPGVGFFTTSRSNETKITRFSTTGNGTTAAPVHYYIKNVPAEFKKTFAKAMDSWNVEFTKTIGKNLLSYEFVDATDPRSELLVPGDIRFNIIEWDIVNKAGYGGLGPSIANQHSGQTMSANVLIQGPTIVDLYTKWFGVSKEARALIADGKTTEASKLMKDFNASTKKEISKRTQTTFKVKLGKHLEMNIPAQRTELEDPIVKGEFEIVPANMTYEKYMEGYMLEILAHEMGHNIGLRHNFKGNLGSYENNADAGSVSRSVMEYLGRPFRYLNTIGSYDRMAIAYGYKGVTPKHLNWFCTDEDQGSDAESMKVKSAECTKSDATSDPFSFFEGRINRVLDLVLEKKSAAAPVWKTAEVSSQLNEAVSGLIAYGLSAEATADTWTNFFGKGDRPETKSEVKPYVLQRIKNKICNPELQDVIKAKESAEAQKLAQDNLTAVTAAVVAKAEELKAFTKTDLACQENR